MQNRIQLPSQLRFRTVSVRATLSILFTRKLCAQLAQSLTHDGPSYALMLLSKMQGLQDKGILSTNGNQKDTNAKGQFKLQNKNELSNIPSTLTQSIQQTPSTLVISKLLGGICSKYSNDQVQQIQTSGRVGLPNTQTHSYPGAPTILLGGVQHTMEAALRAEQRERRGSNTEDSCNINNQQAQRSRIRLSCVYGVVPILLHILKQVNVWSESSKTYLQSKIGRVLILVRNAYLAHDLSRIIQRERRIAP
ncbi:MAG: hypothetical protein EZS28_022358, partial [Streblomastix strix]